MPKIKAAETPICNILISKQRILTKEILSFTEKGGDVGGINQDEVKNNQAQLNAALTCLSIYFHVLP